MRRIIILAAACFMVALLIGCGKPDRRSAPSASDKLRIVASIFPLGDAARQVGGEHVVVLVLLPAGQSPHGYEPQPRQAEAMAGARMLLVVGLGLDLWAERSAAALGKQQPEIFNMADALREAPLPSVETELDENAVANEPAPEHEPANATAPEHEHDDNSTAARRHPGGNDPHIWLDPVRMEQYVNALAGRLGQADPDHAVEYSRNAAKYVEELRALDAEYRRELASVSRREFVSFHSAFTYLAARYGLKTAAVFDANVLDYGPRRLEEVIRFIKEHKVKVIFAEPQFPQDRLKSLADETGVSLAIMDPMGNPGVAGYESYLQMMRSNLCVLSASLKE